MNFNNYQRDASEFARYLGADFDDQIEDRIPAVYPFLALSEEVGELNGKIARLWRGDYESVPIDAVKKELGDVLWNLSECARQLGLSLNSVAAANLAKLTARATVDSICGSGDDR